MRRAGSLRSVSSMSAGLDRPECGCKGFGPKPEVRLAPHGIHTGRSLHKFRGAAAKTLQYVSWKLLRANVRRSAGRETAAHLLETGERTRYGGVLRLKAGEKRDAQRQMPDIGAMSRTSSPKGHAEVLLKTRNRSRVGE